MEGTALASRAGPGRRAGSRAGSRVGARVAWAGLGALALLLLAAAPPAAAQRSGTEVEVRGRVVDAGSGAPVAGATIYLPYADRDLATDSVGGFVAELVPRGLVELAVARDGYRPLHVRVPAFEDRDVTLELEPAEPDRKTGALRGVVRDARSHRPLRFASVRVLGEEDTDVTDGDGRFRLRWVDEGRAVLAVEHLGYEARVVPETVVADSTRDVQILLEERPLPLEGIDVTVQNKWLATGGWYMRKGRGYRGKQWGPQELAALDVESLDEVLVRENTLGVRWQGRPDGFDLEGNPTGGGFLGYGGCPMTVWIDGQRVGPLSLDMIDPDRIAAMEVYTGPWHETPPGYGCGAILLWQKKGG